MHANDTRVFVLIYLWDSATIALCLRLAGSTKAEGEDAWSICEIKL